MTLSPLKDRLPIRPFTKSSSHAYLGDYDRLATLAMLFSVICVVWGLFNDFRKQPVTGGYWGGLVIFSGFPW